MNTLYIGRRLRTYSRKDLGIVSELPKMGRDIGENINASRNATAIDIIRKQDVCRAILDGTNPYDYSTDRLAYLLMGNAPDRSRRFMQHIALTGEVAVIPVSEDEAILSAFIDDKSGQFEEENYDFWGRLTDLILSDAEIGPYTASIGLATIDKPHGDLQPLMNAVVSTLPSSVDVFDVVVRPAQMFFNTTTLR